jgi:hypothetical protein
VAFDQTPMSLPGTGSVTLSSVVLPENVVWTRSASLPNCRIPPPNAPQPAMLQSRLTFELIVLFVTLSAPAL